MRNFDACAKQERLSRQTLLALLTSDLDYSRGIVAQTGATVDFTSILAPVLQGVVEDKVASGTWAYADEYNRPSFRIGANGDLLDDNMSNLVILVAPNWPVPLPVTLPSQVVVSNSREGKNAVLNNVTRNINKGEWLYFEQSNPRKMLLTNPDWTIASFDSRTRNVCVTMNASSGARHLNFTLNNFVTS